MRILVAIDGNPDGERAVAATGRLAQSANADVHLLKVVRRRDREESHDRGRQTALTPSGSPLRPTATSTGAMSDNAAARTREKDEQELRDLAQRYLQKVNVSVSTEVVDDVPRAVVDTATAIGADAICMSARDRGHIGRVMLGSTADDVVRAAPVPVVLVGPGARLANDKPHHADHDGPPYHVPDVEPARISQFPIRHRPAVSVPGGHPVDVRSASMDELIELLASPQWQLRWQAREEVAARRAEAFEPLLRASHSNEHDLRWAAVKGLHEIRDERGIPRLLELMDDESSTIRWAAAEALQAIGRPAVVPILRRLLTDASSIWTQEGAHHVLRELAVPETQPVLRALEGRDASVTVPPRANEALEILE